MTAPATVCIVEDDPAVRASLAALLEAGGYVARLYASGEEFLRSADAAGEGCLIVDVRLPGISGLELLDRLAARGTAYNAVVISGHGDGDSIARPAGLASLEVLAKPCDPRALLSLVAAALEAAAD